MTRMLSCAAQQAAPLAEASEASRCAPARTRTPAHTLARTHAHAARTHGRSLPTPPSSPGFCRGRLTRASRRCDGARQRRQRRRRPRCPAQVGRRASDNGTLGLELSLAASVPEPRRLDHHQVGWWLDFVYADDPCDIFFVFDFFSIHPESLQLTGRRLPPRQVSRFDSNTPHDPPHILRQLSGCSAVCAGRLYRQCDVLRARSDRGIGMAFCAYVRLSSPFASGVHYGCCVDPGLGFSMVHVLDMCK